MKRDITKEVLINTQILNQDEKGVYFMVARRGGLLVGKNDQSIQLIGKIYISEGITFEHDRYSVEFKKDGTSRIMEETKE